MVVKSLLHICITFWLFMRRTRLWQTYAKCCTWPGHFDPFRNDTIFVQ